VQGIAPPGQGPAAAPEPAPPQESVPPQEPAPTPPPPAAEAKVKPELERWQRRLEGHDLHPLLVEELVGEIAENLQEEVRLPDKIISLILRKGLRQRLKTAPEKGAAIQVFVGPTGVGKSTTLAKLAARYALYQGEKVGIITIDHYRIGAIEQMRTYSDITGLPLEVVMSPKELRSAVEKFSGCQRILIDTAGRSSRNMPHIKELAGYIQKLPPCEIFLVISATTKRQDLQLISENFRPLAYNRIIYTKVDETNSYGILLNGSYLTDMPVIYMTNGQSVPDDICLADIETMSSLILGEDE
jgi:flagellar biosynthesis protein FlhF